MESLQSGYKPSLVMIFACLGEIHAERHHKTKRKADLDEAIWATKLALSISSADNSLTAILLNNLANELWRRHRSSGCEDDLQQALDYGFRALESIPQESSHQAAVLSTLGAIRASLYNCRGDFRDLQEAISITQKSIDMATRCAGTASMISFNNLGAYLWTQYCLAGRGDDLDNSVVSFAKALECAPNETVDRVTCLINSGYVLTQRYHRTGQLQDLGYALESAQEAMRLDPQNNDLAILLKCLDCFLERRRESTSSLHLFLRRGDANTDRKSWTPLLLLAAAIFIVILYASHLRTEILLSIVAFPIGIIYHWMISSRRTPEQRISIKDYFPSISSMGTLLNSRGRSQDYNPKLLAMPLIPVPFASSLRNIQSPDFTAYASLLYQQRRQSLTPVKSEQKVTSRLPAAYLRDADERVFVGRHSGHRGASPHRTHQGTPTTGNMTPRSIMSPRLQKKSSPSTLRNIRPQVEAELSPNVTGPSYRQEEAYLTPLLKRDSNMKRRVGTDSGYETSSARHERARDLEYNDINHGNLLSDEQHHESYISHSSAKPVEHVSSPLMPSQKLWAEPASHYSEHGIWEEWMSSMEEEEKEPIALIRQGHTHLKMERNSGLAMGNVTSTRAEVIGYENSRESQSRYQQLYHEELSKMDRADGVQNQISSQEEEVQVFPVPEAAQSPVSARAFVHSLEVRVHAPLTSIDENTMSGQVPRIVEVHDGDPEIETEDFNIDLVDQLAREYLESSTL